MVAHCTTRTAVRGTLASHPNRRTKLRTHPTATATRSAARYPPHTADTLTPVTSHREGLTSTTHSGRPTLALLAPGALRMGAAHFLHRSTLVGTHTQTHHCTLVGLPPYMSFHFEGTWLEP